MCHVYGYAVWAGEVTFTHLNPPLPQKKKKKNTTHPWLPMTVFRGVKPMDCTEEILVFFGISLVL